MKTLAVGNGPKFMRGGVEVPIQLSCRGHARSRRQPNNARPPHCFGMPLTPALGTCSSD